MELHRKDTCFSQCLGKNVKAELAYHHGSKNSGWAQFNGDNPYQEHYGNNWEKELANSTQMRKMRYVHQLTTLFYFYKYSIHTLWHRNVKDLMDHVIMEGNQIWAGTECKDMWMIYHDQLKIWWEKDSQDYLRSLPCPIEGNPNHTWYG